MANYKDNTMTIEKQILINHMPLPLELNETLKQFVFITREEKERKRIEKISQFIKTRIIEVLGQFYKYDNNCEDEQVTNFLRINEERIQAIFNEIMEEDDIDNIYKNDYHLGSMIMEEYDTLEGAFNEIIENDDVVYE